MSVLDFFKKGKMTQEQREWNRMWELWVEDQADSPYAELMTYQSEVNNGGHDQYFTNVANMGDLRKEMTALESILPAKHKNTLQKAYKAYLMLEENAADGNAEKIMEQCDREFYESEGEINRILKTYAKKTDR